MRALVTGAGGYLGGAVVPGLRAEGIDVRALVHRSRPAHLRGVACVEGDVVGGDGLEAACQGCDGVVHLVGALRAPSDAAFHAIHAVAAQRVAEAARRAGARRFVLVSAAGVGPQGTAYQRSKWQGEQAVAAAGLDHTILRPCPVFGPGGPGTNLVRELGGMLRAPLMPVIGDGRYLLQPVASGDVALGVARALQRPVAVGRTYPVGGPEALTYLEVLRRIAAAQGRPLRTVSLPVGWMRAAMPVLQRLPGFPLTVDQLRMLLAGSTADPSAFCADLGIELQPFAGR